MCDRLKDLGFTGVLCTSLYALDFMTSCWNEASKPTFLVEVLVSDLIVPFYTRKVNSVFNSQKDTGAECAQFAARARTNRPVAEAALH
jgi:hypothetical protein